jgi:hypothetical protein
MKALLTREKNKDQTLGVLTYGREKFLTIELPWKNNKPFISCIPDGTYKVVRRNTAKRGEHFHVRDVPGRKWILFHDKVNYIGSVNPKTGQSDIAGCIIPFESLTDLNGDGILDVAPRSSTIALKKMLKVLPVVFTLEIKTVKK